MQPPPLTHSIGAAERALRALLDSRLGRHGLAFPDWTVCVFLNAERLGPEVVAQRQLAGQIVASADESKASLRRLVAAGLVAAGDDGLLALTQSGMVLFSDLGTEVREFTQALFGDLPAADLEATRRTLLEITHRANTLLAGAG